MLQLMLLLLLVPLSSCDAPSHDAGDKTVSEEEYHAMKLLWEQEHKGVVDHLEVKRSKIKPSYIHQLDINDHHIDMLDLSTFHHHTSHEQPEHHKISHEQPEHHKTSHEQPTEKIATVDRSRRQEEHQVHMGSGSGSAMMCVDPPVPSNGDYVSNGSVLTYMCEEGFVLVGNRVRYCNLTTWLFNGSDPTCEGPCEQDEPFSGSCDTVMSLYYYNAARDRCLPFDGCPATQSGHNSYNSLMNCRDTCMASCNDSEGIERLHRALWISNDCQVCSCVNGIISCVPVNCPAVSCEGNSTPITIDGECCPVCPTPEPCNTTDGERLHNETYTTDDCEQCTCTNGRVTCSPPNTPSESCDPVDDCSIGVIEFDDEICCFVCKPNITDGSCEANNMTYSDGEIFMKDLCTTCQCNNGTINCTTESCLDCEQGTKPVINPSQCCPVCLSECELMENDPETLTLFEVCTSVTPIVLHSCPEQCLVEDVSNDDVTNIHCCITTYFTNSTQFECANLPGVVTDLKFVDANDCTCEPCG